MHEYGLAAEIIETATEVAAGAGAQRITAVHVLLDPAGHIDGQTLADAFEVAAANTRAAGARLRTSFGGTGGITVTAVDIEP